MVHSIHVCLEHKKIWHSLRASGRHAYLSHGEATYLDMEKQGIFVDIGVCPTSQGYSVWSSCSLKMRDATEKELQLARDIKDGKVRRRQ